MKLHQNKLLKKDLGLKLQLVMKVAYMCIIKTAVLRLSLIHIYRVYINGANNLKATRRLRSLKDIAGYGDNDHYTCIINRYCKSVLYVG